MLIRWTDQQPCPKDIDSPKLALCTILPLLSFWNANFNLDPRVSASLHSLSSTFSDCGEACKSVETALFLSSPDAAVLTFISTAAQRAHNSLFFSVFFLYTHKYAQSITQTATFDFSFI